MPNATTRSNIPRSREIETPAAGIAKQIRVLVALVRDAAYQHLFLINMKPVARTRQNDVAARCVVIPRDGEVQKTCIPWDSLWPGPRASARWSIADSVRTSS